MIFIIALTLWILSFGTIVIICAPMILIGKLGQWIADHPGEFLINKLQDWTEKE